MRQSPSYTEAKVAVVVVLIVAVTVVAVLIVVVMLVIFRMYMQNLKMLVYNGLTYRCNGRVQLTDVHAAGRVLTVVRVVWDPPIFTRLHGRLSGVRVQVDELLPWKGTGPKDGISKSRLQGNFERNAISQLKRTDVTDEVVGTVWFPSNDAQRLRQHEAVLQKTGHMG